MNFKQTLRCLWGDWFYSGVVSLQLVLLRGRVPAAGGRDLTLGSFHGVIRLKYAGVGPDGIKSFLHLKFP